VQNTRADPLFTVTEMERAAEKLTAIYSSGGAPEHFRASWYDGRHQFSRAMQTEAFDWFGRWLK
jgi:predicted esterase